MKVRSSTFVVGHLVVAIVASMPVNVAGAEDFAPNGFDKSRSEPHGKVATDTYESKSLGFARKLTIYMPPEYKKGTKYPVLYLLHGSGDDETSWVKKGAASEILDNLYADGKAVPMLVVMPYGFTNPPGKPPIGRNATAGERQKAALGFEQDLLDDVIPYVESHYSVIADHDHRALAGLSMGGGQTMRIGPKHCATFAYLGVFSAGIRRRADGKEDDVTVSYPGAATLNASLKLFWVSCGDRDPGLEGAKKLEQVLTDKKITHVWHQDSGAHEWPVWKNDLYLVAQRLFKVQ